MIKKTYPYSPQDTKLAYQIVQDDLFYTLAQLKDGQSFRLGSLGKFTKKEHCLRSALFKKELGNKNKFTYYKVSFKPFSKLKELLTNQIIKKYQLR
jgi:hypothetical protein